MKAFFRMGMRVGVAVVVVTCAGASMSGAVRLGSPFGDHMVLQREKPVPVWGAAEPGETVVVEFAGQRVQAVAGSDGRWRVELAPMAASLRGATLRAAGDRSAAVERRDVLVGDVWLCGGQSNMERQLGPREGQPDIIGWERAAARAELPLIRELHVTQRTSAVPRTEAEVTWRVCSPETVADFSAVGYFFAHDLFARLGVPIGIIHASWGGTPAEAWTSVEGLDALDDFDSALEMLALARAEPVRARQEFEHQLAEWYRHNDPTPEPNETAEAARAAGAADGWQPLPVPALWEAEGHAGYDGIAWLRREFDLPETWRGGEVELRLGPIDDFDTTWVNGVEVGGGGGWTRSRVYRVPGPALRPKGNVIVVRVLDTGGGGGLWDPKRAPEVASLDGTFTPIALSGRWQARFPLRLADAKSPPPVEVTDGPNAPTVLFNGMIAPLVPYALRGFAFYQGESNADRAAQYRTLLPALIRDWRRQWQEAELPFLFVQIAPFQGQPPEIREAQFLAWRATPRTAMVVTIDCGDPADIHPADKQPVGARLALAARALADGEPIVYSGPAYRAMERRGREIVLRFDHVGGGLVAPGGTLEGFTVAGADGVFRPAQARIEGETIVVSGGDEAQPRAVRYAWANVAAGNLFNRDGLPASPFRTDVE